MKNETTLKEIVVLQSDGTNILSIKEEDAENEETEILEKVLVLQHLDVKSIELTLAPNINLEESFNFLNGKLEAYKVLEKVIVTLK